MSKTGEVPTYTGVREPIKLHALFHSSFPARVHKGFAGELRKSDTLNFD